uniref:Uncharacterized protein n=1 Tax=Arundo donax TaxID=35708 RepID=A0A0A9AQ98_ARUDO
MVNEVVDKVSCAQWRSLATNQGVAIFNAKAIVTPQGPRRWGHGPVWSKLS